MKVKQAETGHEVLPQACDCFLQLVGLFQALSRRKTNLQKLDLTGVNLSQLEPCLLAEGLAGLEEVNS